MMSLIHILKYECRKEINEQIDSSHCACFYFAISMGASDTCFALALVLCYLVHNFCDFASLCGSYMSVFSRFACFMLAFVYRVSLQERQNVTLVKCFLHIIIRMKMYACCWLVKNNQ